MLTYPGVTEAGASRWAWRDRQGWTGPIYGVLHATASPGATAKDVYDYFMGPNSGACSHFVIGKAGEVYQCADPNWAAAANCCPSNPSPFVQYFKNTNANYGTWSIEILKNDSNNQDILTEAQFKAVVAVSKWLTAICDTKPVWCSDSSGGIVSHSYLDPMHRPGNNDPGPFDWERYFRELVGVEKKYMEQQFETMWMLGAGVKPDGSIWHARKSGIYQIVKAGFLAKKYSAQMPTSDEYENVDWSGVKHTFQNITSGHVEYLNGKATVYDMYGQAMYSGSL